MIKIRTKRRRINDHADMNSEYSIVDQSDDSLNLDDLSFESRKHTTPKKKSMFLWF